MEKTTTVVSDKVEETTNERNVSKTTLMKTFNNLTIRIAKTDLLTEEEFKALIKLKNRAMEVFLKTF